MKKNLLYKNRQNADKRIVKQYFKISLLVIAFLMGIPYLWAEIYTPKDIPGCYMEGSSLDQSLLDEMIWQFSLEFQKPPHERNHERLKEFLESKLGLAESRTLQALIMRTWGPRGGLVSFLNIAPNLEHLNRENQLRRLKEACDKIKMLSQDRTNAIQNITYLLDLDGKWNPLQFEYTLNALKDIRASLPVPESSFLVCSDNLLQMDDYAYKWAREMKDALQKIQLALPERGQTCCVCQTDISPEWQKPFFRKGCRDWLSHQEGCAFEEVREEIPVYMTDKDAIQLPHICDSGTLKLGYVGHWHGGLTNFFVKNALVPTARLHNVTIQYDNTACEALKSPHGVQDELSHVILPKNVDISITGNQCISWGAWEYYLGKGPNVSCKVGTQCSAPEFPSCAPHLNQMCLDEGAIVTCLNEQNQRTPLTCCERRFRSLSGIGESREWVFIPGAGCR